MEFIFLLIAIIFIFSFFSTSKDEQYIKYSDDEENFCAPTKYNPANGAPMIGCLDIYGNPYGVSGAENNHTDSSYNDSLYEDTTSTSSYDDSYNSSSSDNSHY